MATWQANVRADLSWRFEVEADTEDLAYEELWDLIGYDGEDVYQSDFSPDSEYFDIDLRPVSD